MKKTALRFSIAIILIAFYSCSDSNKTSNDAVVDEGNIVTDTITEVEEESNDIKNEELDAIVS